MSTTPNDSTADRKPCDDPDKVKREHWKMVREAIIHEDNLVNHRLTWLLLAEGFLLGGFAAVQASVLSNRPPSNLFRVTEILLALVFVIAIWYCFIVATVIAMAHEHHCHLREWWMNKYSGQQIHPVRLKFSRLFFTEAEVAFSAKNPPTSEPPLAGYFPFWRLLSLKMIPLLFIFLDAIIIVFCVVVPYLTPSSSSPAATREVRIKLERAEESPKAKVGLDQDEIDQKRDRLADQVDGASENIPSKVK